MRVEDLEPLVSSYFIGSRDVSKLKEILISITQEKNTDSYNTVFVEYSSEDIYYLNLNWYGQPLSKIVGDIEGLMIYCSESFNNKIYILKPNQRQPRWEPIEVRSKLTSRSIIL